MSMATSNSQNFAVAGDNVDAGGTNLCRPNL